MSTNGAMRGVVVVRCPAAILRRPCMMGRSGAAARICAG
eukprot:COSAG05_NODE_22881_length_261_cov_1.598765_2_plen_38_part_01